MNLVFIGASKFGLRCLQACADLPQVNVVGGITLNQITYDQKDYTGPQLAELLRGGNGWATRRSA